MQLARVGLGLVLMTALVAARAPRAHAQSTRPGWLGGGSGGVNAHGADAVSPRTAVAVPPVTPALVTLDMTAVHLRAVLDEIARQSGVHLYYSRSDVPVDQSVSLAVRAVTVTDALQHALAGTGVVIRVWSSNQIVLKRDPSSAPRHVRRLGVLHGRVSDAKTGVAIAGAQVSVDSAQLGVMTDDDGGYRIASVPAGPHLVTARRIGYTQDARHVTVGVDQDVTVDFALESSASLLDQVVVTGTIAPTQERAIPTPISVVTAHDIAQLGITDIAGVFRGSVPGAIDVDAGSHDGYPGLSFRGGIDFNQVYSDAPTKVYVDGVEMAYTNALSQIDPNTIDHIEITRGPQASTLYGAGAMVGVIQVFTKKGSGDLTHPDVDAQVSAGALQSQWSGATLHQDHSVGLEGGTTAFSYAGRASYTSTGAWVPEYKSQRGVYSGSVSSTIGAVQVQLTGQYSDRIYDTAPLDPAFVNQVRDGHWQTGFNAFFTQPYHPDISRTDGTYGLNLTYQTASWWTNRIVLGYDGYDNPRGETQARLTTPSDTLRSYGEFQRSRTSVAYNSTVDTKLTASLVSTLTVGVDHWQTHEMSLSAKEHANDTFAPGATLTKYAYANTGLFAQEQLGIANALFLTVGVRGDRNDNFGSGYGTAVAPRVGVSYAGKASEAVRFKLRASYGKAIEAPFPLQKNANNSNLPFSQQLASPALGPETQSGYDAGFELYLGSRASVQATYYNQRVDDLISTVTLSQPGDSTTVYRYGNAGRIKNTGWEFQGKVGFGRLTVAGTYSIFNSIVQRLDPGALGDETGQYHVGDRLLLIPRASGGLNAGVSAGGTTLNLGLTYIGSFRNYDELAYYTAVLGEGSSAPARSFLIDYPSSVKLNTQITQRINRWASVFLTVDNLTNSYRSEVDNISAVYGRLTVVGVKARW